jgi:CheY-like chemotaxis protein
MAEATPGVGQELLVLLSLLPEPTLLAEASGRILAANPACERLLQVARGSLSGRTLHEFVGDDAAALSDYLTRSPHRAQLAQEPLRLRAEDGREMSWRLAAAALPGSHTQSGQPIVLVRLTPTRESLAAEASSDFLANLAHELRNPLAPISNALQVMKVAEGDRVVTGAARSMIERQVQQLVRLIDDLVAVPVSASEAGGGEPQSRRMPLRARILVADDNPDAAQSLAFMLELEGHDVRTARDGIEAIEVAERFNPQLILLDIGMPRLDGYEVAREIRARPWGATVCLVALTGWGQEEDRRRAQEAGFDRHLVKPVDPATLNALIQILHS